MKPYVKKTFLFLVVVSNAPSFQTFLRAIQTKNSQLKITLRQFFCWEKLFYIAQQRRELLKISFRKRFELVFAAITSKQDNKIQLTTGVSGNVKALFSRCVRRIGMKYDD